MVKDTLSNLVLTGYIFLFLKLEARITNINNFSKKCLHFKKIYSLSTKTVTASTFPEETVQHELKKRHMVDK